MEQSHSWEADSHQATQEISSLLWNTKVHYHVHKSPSLGPILRERNPLHTFPPYFPKIHTNIILPSTPWSSELSSPDFPPKVLYAFRICACYMSLQSHPPWFNHPNNIWWSLQVMKFLIMQSSPASRYFLRLTSKYSPQHPVLKHPQSVLFP
jgi:hypothetical protein